MSEATLEGPIHSRSKDRDSVIELLRKCFPGTRDLGEPTINRPYCYRIIKDSLVMKDGPKVVSHLGCVDQVVMTGRRTIRSAGIGWVGTDPAYRRRGLMTRLLMSSIEEMTQKGYALSDLEGDRQRYGRFGWELAGRTWHFNISPRSLEPWGKPVGFEVAPYTAASEEVKATLRLHNRQQVGLKRDRTLHLILLSRFGKEAWIARKDDSIRSYAVVYRQEKRCRVDELGGDAAAVHAIVDHMIRGLGVESVNVSMPWSHPLNAKLRALSSGWSLGCLRMMKILDLQATLDPFAEQLGSVYRRMGFRRERAIALGFEGGEPDVELIFSRHGVSIGQVRRRRGTVVIPERRMVRLLFGPSSPADIGSLPPRARFIEALLPVDFFLWRNEAV